MIYTFFSLTARRSSTFVVLVIITLSTAFFPRSQSHERAGSQISLESTVEVEEADSVVLIIQGSPDNITPLGIGKCHLNRMSY